MQTFIKKALKRDSNATQPAVATGAVTAGKTARSTLLNGPCGSVTGQPVGMAEIY